MRSAKVLKDQSNNWPSPETWKKMDKILAKAKGSRGLPPKATLLDRFKWDLCGEFVRYCVEHDISQRELAKKIHVSESRISEIVHYHIDKLTLDRLTKYLDKLKPKAKISVA
jgi:predicted XRE-type DNA-binding protein